MLLPLHVISATTAAAPVRNTAPTISGTPSTSVQTGNAYSFTPQTADANGDLLAFSIQNKPSWATFCTVTGALTGTPSTAGTYSGVTISVSDGSTLTNLAGYRIVLFFDGTVPRVVMSRNRIMLGDRAHICSRSPTEDSCEYPASS